jgi:uncharacterized membrane protein YwzB
MLRVIICNNAYILSSAEQIRLGKIFHVTVQDITHLAMKSISHITFFVRSPVCSSRRIFLVINIIIYTVSGYRETGLEQLNYAPHVFHT